MFDNLAVNLQWVSQASFTFKVNYQCIWWMNILLQAVYTIADSKYSGTINEVPWKSWVCLRKHGYNVIKKQVLQFLPFQLLLSHLFEMLFTTLARDKIFLWVHQVLKFKVVFWKELEPVVRMEGEGMPWQLCYWVAVGIEKVFAEKKKTLQETAVMILGENTLE